MTQGKYTTCAQSVVHFMDTKEVQMIERDPEEGGYYVVCDFCSNDVNIQRKEFMHAIDALKRRGWKVIRDELALEWLHKCPDCQRKQ